MTTRIVLAVALFLALPIVASAGNQAPHACFEVTVQNCFLTVCFDASCSFDDNGIILYTWLFGDGTGGNGETVCHTYPAEGDYTVKLTVFDGNPLVGGKTGSTQQVVHATDCQ
jgi:PKD repeat protein